MSCQFILSLCEFFFFSLSFFFHHFHPLKWIHLMNECRIEMPAPKKAREKTQFQKKRENIHSFRPLALKLDGSPHMYILQISVNSIIVVNTKNEQCLIRLLLKAWENIKMDFFPHWSVALYTLCVDYFIFFFSFTLTSLRSNECCMMLNQITHCHTIKIHTTELNWGCHVSFCVT